MIRPKKIIFIMIILIIGGGGILYLSSFDRFKINGVIKGAKKAVEHEDIDNLMAYVSLKYIDDYGFNYPMAKRLMSGLFKDFNEFEVVKKDLVINVQDNTATVSFSLWVSVDWNENPAYIVGTNRAAASILVYLEKDFIKWKVVKVEGVR